MARFQRRFTSDIIQDIKNTIKESNSSPKSIQNIVSKTKPRAAPNSPPIRKAFTITATKYIVVTPNNTPKAPYHVSKNNFLIFSSFIVFFLYRVNSGRHFLQANDQTLNEGASGLLYAWTLRLARTGDVEDKVFVLQVGGDFP